jgi:hypothetical protein
MNERSAQEALVRIGLVDEMTYPGSNGELYSFKY